MRPMYLPTPILPPDEITPGSLSYQAPSNIALVKYWGKHGRQLPRNPNASLTLTVARTETTLEWTRRTVGTASQPGGVSLELFYDGEAKLAFAKRVTAFFTSLLDVYPWLAQLHWTVRTRNTFPHGAGIASSASAMGALAMCLVAFEREYVGGEDRSLGFARDDGARGDAEHWQRKASYLARLGSGSASRSVFAKAAAWGQSAALDGSSDEYAVGLADQLHPVFHDYRDTILLVSDAEKAVSSSAGHGLMEGQAYAKTRYALATQRFERLLGILKGGELDDFCALVEQDALDLHALMMQSTPPYLLIEPETVAIVKAVRGFRESAKVPLCFTLDAGPNVHLLYPKSAKAEVDAFVEAELMRWAPGGKIEDEMGEGAGSL